MLRAQVRQLDETMNLINSQEYISFMETDFSNSIGVRLLMADQKKWDIENQVDLVSDIKIRSLKLQSAIKYIIENLLKIEDEEQIQVVMYDAAKIYYGESKDQIRNCFADLYSVLFNKPSGPRWGVFISLYGMSNFIMMIMNKVIDIHHV